MILAGKKPIFAAVLYILNEKSWHHGQSGFVGSYLYNTISLHKEEFTLIPFDKSFFDDQAALAQWAGQCDVIVHLAAMNRHPDAQVIHGHQY